MDKTNLKNKFKKAHVFTDTTFLKIKQKMTTNYYTLKSEIISTRRNVCLQINSWQNCVIFLFFFQ